MGIQLPAQLIFCALQTSVACCIYKMGLMALPASQQHGQKKSIKVWEPRVLLDGPVALGYLLAAEISSRRAQQSLFLHEPLYCSRTSPGTSQRLKRTAQPLSQSVFVLAGPEPCRCRTAALKPRVVMKFSCWWQKQTLSDHKYFICFLYLLIKYGNCYDLWQDNGLTDSLF